MLDTVDNSRKIVNLDYLNGISKGNTKFVNDMIKIFLDENPEEIAKLEKEIANENYDLIKSIIHKLRSTIPFIGLDKVIDREVAEIEELATKRTGIEMIKPLFEKVKAMCEKACYELQPI